MTVSKSEIIDFIKSNGLSSCDEVAEYFDHPKHSTQKILNSLEINKKVTPKIVRTGNGRECRYYIPEVKSKKQQPNFKYKESKPDFEYKGGKESKYKPPFIDQDKHSYSSIDELMTRFNLAKSTIKRYLQKGIIGYNGNPPQVNKPNLKYNAPYIDAKGNSFKTKKAVCKKYNISYTTLYRWLDNGCLGYNGNKPTRTKNKKARPQKWYPPYIDKDDNIYHSRQEIIDKFGCKSKTISSWLHRGKLKEVNGNATTKTQ